MKLHRGRRGIATIAALVVLGSACARGGQPEPLVVSSDDGLFTVEVPAELVPEGEEITVTQRSGADIPELKRAV